MELLCPNCQQKLTVPDQYAGQPMKCPLCSGPFTTPSLPPAPGPAYVAPTPSSVAVTPLPPPANPRILAAPDGSAPATPPVPIDVVSVTPGATVGPREGEYRHRVALSLNSRVLPWLAAGALILVFVLTFFAWAGFYPGGIHVTSQNAWQAAFGSYTEDPDWAAQSPTGKDVKDRVEPGASVLLIFFILFLLVAALAALAAALLGVITVHLPPVMQQLRPWWWAIVSAMAFLVFLFLVFQVFAGFGLVNKMHQRADSELATRARDASASDKKVLEYDHAIAVGALRLTCAFWLAFWMSLLALVCAAATFWVGQGHGRLLPRLVLMW